MTTTIKLGRGEEVIVNGFVIRAIGLTEKPDQLHIRRRAWPMLWAGLCDDVTTGPSICVGTEPDKLPERVRKHHAYVVNRKPSPND